MADERRIIFTLEQANRLCPRLNLLVGEQMARRQSIEAQLGRWAGLLGRPRHPPTDLALRPGESEAIRGAKFGPITQLRRVTVDEEAWRDLEELGGYLKDPKLGLVDFYGRIDLERKRGQPSPLVWLCWKYGETQFSHDHALDQGFSGRKPIPEAAAACPQLN